MLLLFTLTTQLNPRMNSQKERERESEFIRKKMQNLFLNLCVSYDLGQEKDLDSILKSTPLICSSTWSKRGVIEMLKKLYGKSRRRQI